MNHSMIQKVPGYIQKELEAIGKYVKPLIKKSSIFTFISFPMIMFASINFLFLVLNGAVTRDAMPYLLFLAVFGAIGMALLKESRSLQKDIQVISNNYMVERISKSEAVTDAKKKEFISIIKNQPILGFNTFVSFLEEEKKQEIFD